MTAIDDALDAYAQRLVDAAPPADPERFNRIRLLLMPNTITANPEANRVKNRNRQPGGRAA